MNKLLNIFKDKYDSELIKSPYWRSRTESSKFIIVHGIAEYIEDHGYCVDFLKSRGWSAHFFIKPDGSQVKTVDPKKVAFHAGESQWRSFTRLNKNSIGIEVMVKGTWNYTTFIKEISEAETYTFNQYDSTATLTTLLAYQYNIPLERILRHSDVSGPDVRDDPKRDPGDGFDWIHFKTLTEELLNQLKSVNTEDENV